MYGHTPNVFRLIGSLQSDSNVVIVGWELGSQRLWYPQSVSDTRSIGAEIGMVAANIMARFKTNRSRLYCVGHSLGAHVCGHAGMKTKFGRITGIVNVFIISNSTTCGFSDRFRLCCRRQINGTCCNGHKLSPCIDERNNIHASVFSSLFLFH